jgi:hypothetical protein
MMKASHPPVPAMLAPERGQSLFQVNNEQLALLGFETFLDFQEVLHFLFFQADLKSADLLNFGLHRRPRRQIFLLEEGKEFPALLRQFL